VSAPADPAVIDLRSDTVTRPTAAMRRAMAEAEVGDDVYREDPTVRRLEETAAAMLGKAAALFVPSGTMGNQIAVKVWTRPGQEVILEAHSHILDYELGQMAAFSGVVPRALPGRNGLLDEAAVRGAVRGSIYYVSQTGLVALENTHMVSGGAILDQQEVERVAAFARGRRIPLHLDGARLFNAAVARGVGAGDLARPFDSVMVCLSKGLGAPIGSILAGPKEFIDEAVVVRKRLGGGMRQAGIVAAAGIVALRDQVERLAEDHALARRLGERLQAIPGVRLDPPRIETNMAIFALDEGLPGADDVVEAWAKRGVKSLAVGARRVRAVTHYDVRAADLDEAADRLAAWLREKKGAGS
jgi:threonine aldolase